ncbi:YTH domain-containing protein 1-like isoform X1 [Bolinopsis microptera]|uniref:YTH domain-containing protein 1-like isoform X1 n=1 Tax=Bolinopsis microptera TaxID=2820187 RepID=UPI003078EB5E
MSDIESDSVVVKEEPKDDDKDIVMTNSEMVLDDILGDDIIGESSDQEITERGLKKITAPDSDSKDENSPKRSRNNSYASDLSSAGSISKRSSKADWHSFDARYFVIKSNNMDNVEISMEKGVWATPRRNEDMLVEAFRHTKHVILIFSVRESGAFQGVARMMSMPRPNNGDVHWIVGSTPILRLLPNVFKVQWLDKSPLDFTKTSHLKNRWNEWKQVKISRDGTEIEPTCAADLCTLWQNCENPEDHTPVITSRRRKNSENAARASRSDEPVSPSAVKTTYSSYKDSSYRKSSPEPMSDGEPAPPGLSSRMKDRLGGGGSSSRGDEEKKPQSQRKKRDEPASRPPRRDYRPRNDNNRYNSHRGSNRNNSSREDRSDRRPDRRERDTRPARSSRPSHRSRSRSPVASSSKRRSPPKESSAKDILLHGSYLDYVREYQSKHSRLAALLQDPVLRQDIFNAAQVAASAGTSSSSSSRTSRRRKDEKYLDSRAHSALVDEFLSTHNRR